MTAFQVSALIPLPLMGRGRGGVMSPEGSPHFIDVTPTQPSPNEGEGLATLFSGEGR
jgi:hypothetical protein